MIHNEQLGGKLDLLDLTGSDTNLRRVASTSGGEYAGPCPWCGGQDRFRVWPVEGRYWCRQCERSGDAIQYLREFRGLTFHEACMWVEVIGVSPPKPTTESTRTAGESCSHSAPPRSWREKVWTIVSACEAALWGAGGANARRYLHERRGLREPTIRKYRLGYSPSGHRFHGLWVPQGITIPSSVGDELWCLRVRTPHSAPGKKYRHVSGGKAGLFGLDNLQGHSDAFLCEGEFDAMLLDQEAGDLAAVIALGGVSNQLRPWLSYLVGLRRVFSALDLDGPGRKRARELLVASRRMKPVLLPSLDGKVSDLTDYWGQGGSLRDWAEYHLAKDSFRKHGVIQDEIVF